MKPTRYAKCNYKNLLPLLQRVDYLPRGSQHCRLEAAGFMPLVIEKLYDDADGRTVYSLTHYGEQNGDLMADPDMTLKVDHDAGTVEPLSFQNDYMGLYQQVYIERDGQRLYSPRLRSQLDDFLRQWLKNIEMQGYLETA